MDRVPEGNPRAHPQLRRASDPLGRGFPWLSTVSPHQTSQASLHAEAVCALSERASHSSEARYPPQIEHSPATPQFRDCVSSTRQRLPLTQGQCLPHQTGASSIRRSRWVLPPFRDYVSAIGQGPPPAQTLVSPLSQGLSASGTMSPLSDRGTSLAQGLSSPKSLGFLQLEDHGSSSLCFSMVPGGQGQASGSHWSLWSSAEGQAACVEVKATRDNLAPDAHSSFSDWLQLLPGQEPKQ